MKKLFLYFTLCFFSFCAYSTHERAGEITYRWISGFTYEITLITYTFTPSPADRPELDVYWGDGSFSTIPRNEKINMPNNISKNTYIGIHSYSSSGIYTISMEDPNRNYGILNIPNSVNIPFYLETTLMINPFIGANNSPVLLNPPIDNGCVNQLYVHNPGAYDSDGDSLSYKLGVCKGEDGLDIPGYILPLASNSITINPYTGDLVWENPVMQGEYNVAIIIEEWRYGVLVGTVLRDLQIQIVACNNQQPHFAEIKDTCVEAGSYLQFNVSASDVDNNIITLSATGGPLIQTINPAQFLSVSGTGTVNSMFSWHTACEHVRKQPWQVYFKATDNGQPVNLVDIKTYHITVVAPAPENLTLQPAGNSIILNWNTSPCYNAIGYRIYRRNGYYGYFHSYCETGVPSYTGYVKIADIQGINNTNYIDDNNGQGLIQGIDYCYMVIAYFEDGAESYASVEECTSLIHDSPVITNVSVRNTSNTQGSIYVAWSKPTEIDTLQYLGPYKYIIFRSNGFYGSNLVKIDSLNSLNDTIYIDTLLNTKDNAYSYRIDLINNAPGNYAWIGSSQVASSVFLSITPSDNKLHLSWFVNAPWTNEHYEIYKYNNYSSSFDSITTVVNPHFNDTALVNGNEYCYKIKTVGKYSAPGFITPIINWSQIKCDYPVDTEPPCSPVLQVESDCYHIQNILHWYLPYDTCNDDVAAYEIYYSPTDNGDYSLVHHTNNIFENSFVHSDLISIAGCYMIISIDSFNNHSLPVNPVCIDIDVCGELYNLPNVFTPDGDGVNDFFKPYEYKFVDKIDLTIFNRWGNIVFKTYNPDINWDGKNEYTGQKCSDGVYYYVCDVYENRLKGKIKRNIHGFFHLISK